jgi:quercetin dioxygenase-like cupin family protein
MRNLFTSAEYPKPGVHDDHEGFYVVSGHGRLLVDGQEYELHPGTAMFAPAGLPHAIKTTGGELEIFIYHFPVTEE